MTSETGGTSARPGAEKEPEGEGGPEGADAGAAPATSAEPPEPEEMIDDPEVASDPDPRLSRVPMIERKAYVRLLTAMARADGEITEPELRIIRTSTDVFDLELREADLDEHDLEKLASSLERRSLRERLFGDLKRLIEVDATFEPAELQTIKYLAERWGLEPPAVAGVDWARIEPPKNLAAHLAARAASRRRAVGAVTKAAEAAGGLAITQRLQSIDIGSAALVGLCFGVFEAVLWIPLAILLVQPTIGSEAGIAIGGLLLGTPVAFVATALLYNLAAVLTGGLKVQLSR